MCASKRRKVILLHDNARLYVAHQVKQPLYDFKWEVLPHPSPDIAPSDYHLFRSMVHSLSNTHFQCEADLRKWIEDYIESKDETFFRRGIHMLPKRW